MADDISKEDLKKEVAAFLKGQDLKKMTAKKVRQGIEEKLDCDLTSRKKELDDIVMEYMKNVGKSAKNGNKDDENDDDEDEEEEEKDEDDENDKDDEDAEEEDEEEDEDSDDKKSKKSAPKKAAAKRKAASDDSEEESDVPEKGSDEEYSPNKKAKTGGARGRKPKGKKKKADSDVSDSDEDWKGNSKKGAKKGAKKGGGGGGRQSAFTKTCKLSPELAAVVGQDSMARPEVVKKVWAIIKEQNLYDPKNKQYAICNDELMKVIGTKRFRTFGMMKYLKKHFIN